MNTPLADAVLRGAVEEARALLVAGASPNGPVNEYPAEWNLTFDYRPAPLLLVATLTGHLELVRLLLEFGADVNVRPEIERSYLTHDDTYFEPGDSALELALRKGWTVMVDLLLSAGAKTDADSERALKKLRR